MTKDINNKIIIKNVIYIIKLIAKKNFVLLISNIIYPSIKAIIAFISSIWIIEFVINSIQNKRDIKYTTITVLIIFVLQFLSDLYDDWYKYVYYPVVILNIKEKLLQNLYKKSEEVKLECFEDPEFYNQYIKTISEINERIDSIINSISEVFYCTTYFIVNILFIININSVFLIFSIIPVLANLCFSKKEKKINYQFNMKKQEEIRKQEYSKRIYYLNDYAKELRLTRISKVLFIKFTNSTNKLITYIKKYGLKLAVIDYIKIELQEAISYLGAITLAVYLTVVKKIMLYGECLVITSTITEISSILEYFTSVIFEFYEHGIYFDNYRKFIEYQTDIDYCHGKNIFNNKSYEIQLNNVSFKYKDQKKEALSNINLIIKPKERIAIVGANGSGKSTLIKIILRLYDPLSGEVLLNKENIKNYNIKSYRNIFACIFQDFKLFSLPIYYNVIMKLDEGKEINCINALKKSGIYDKIKELKKGIFTIMFKEFEENGVVLSGGEQQKLAISRIYAGDHEINIFDEPSSALDPIAESELYTQMLRAAKNSTIIFVSHRLFSTIMVDRILYMEEGRIVEEGSHSELIKKNGKYANMFMTQVALYSKKEDTKDE